MLILLVDLDVDSGYEVGSNEAYCSFCNTVFFIVTESKSSDTRNELIPTELVA